MSLKNQASGLPFGQMNILSTLPPKWMVNDFKYNSMHAATIFHFL